MVNSFPPLIFCESTAAIMMEMTSPTICESVISRLTRKDFQNERSVNAFPKFAKEFQLIVAMFMPFMSQNMVTTAIHTGTAEKSRKPRSGMAANAVPHTSSFQRNPRFLRDGRGKERMLSSPSRITSSRVTAGEFSITSPL